MFSLQNKVAIVTGAGSGIGAAIAEAFAKAGALVYVADCHKSNGEEIASKITTQGGRANLVVMDVTQENECQSLVKLVLGENSNQCHVLVNNAGIGHVGTILTTEFGDLDRLWKV